MEHRALKSLHTALIDAREGYEKAAQETDETALATLFGDMITLHSKAHRDVHESLLEAGEEPDDSGSFMGTVHRTVIGVRSAVTGIDKDSLDSFASGEERIADKYADAIEDQREPKVAEMLRVHQSALLDMIDRMKRIANEDELGIRA